MEASISRLEFTRDTNGHLQATIDGKAMLTVQAFKDFVYVDLREFYSKKNGGEILPTKRGVTLKRDEWTQLCTKSAEVRADIIRLSNLLAADGKPTISPIIVQVTNDITVSVHAIATIATAVRVTIQKTTRKRSPQFDTAATTSQITLTPLAWQKVFESHRTEIESIVTLLDDEASLAREKRKHDKIAEEARCFQSFLDLSTGV